MSKIEEAMTRLRGGDRPTLDREIARSGKPGVRVATRPSGDLARMDQPRQWTAAERAAVGVLDFATDGAPGTDVFRQLRVAIAERLDQRNVILGVTGVERGAGASFVSANLAASLALDRGRSAMLIDCDVQNRTVSRLRLARSGEASGAGADDCELDRYLFDAGIDEADIIHPTGWPRLRVIPLGQPGGHDELFTAPRLAGLFDHLRRRYSDRTIVVDMPPVGEVADARIIGQLCDGVVLVVPYGRVTSDQVEQALERIGHNRLVGTVFNRQPAGLF